MPNVCALLEALTSGPVSLLDLHGHQVFPVTSCELSCSVEPEPNTSSSCWQLNEPQVTSLVSALRQGAPLQRLRALYARARPAYEQLEVLAPAFPDQDEAIDARPYGFAEGALASCLWLCACGSLLVGHWGR